VQHVSGAPLIRGLGYLDPCDATIPGLQRTTFVALAHVIIAFPGRGAACEWCTADPGSWVSRSLPCDDPGSAAHRFALRRARETVSGGSAPNTLYPLVGLRDITMGVTLFSPGCWHVRKKAHRTAKSGPQDSRLTGLDSVGGELCDPAVPRHGSFPNRSAVVDRR
jgi:hypothetical protein